MIVIGDIHGNFLTFMALLKQLPKGEEIFLTGDLVDRGPRSKEVIDFLIKNPQIKCVKGNHEDMFLDFLDGKPYSSQDFLRNGGRETLDSYKGDEIVGVYGKKSVVMEVPEEHEEYIRNLPDYIETDEIIVSHTADIRDRWYRGFSIYPQDTKKFHIFGHTPTKKVILTRRYALIDTGACYVNYKGYGKLTAISFPLRKIWQQENIDE